MRVKVVLVPEGSERSLELPKGARILDVLKKLGLNREMHVVKLNGEVVVEEEALRDGDVLEVIRVVSGG